MLSPFLMYSVQRTTEEARMKSKKHVHPASARHDPALLALRILEVQCRKLGPVACWEHLRELGKEARIPNSELQCLYERVVRSE